VVTAFLPTRSKNVALDFILRTLNVLAGSVLKNKNKDDEG